MVSLVVFLLVPVVEVAVGVAMVQDPLAAVEVPVVRPLDLRDDPLLPGVQVELVVERLVIEPVARGLGGVYGQ